MKKLVKNLNVNDYDHVEDMLLELLYEHYGIEQLTFENLEKDVEYVCGAIYVAKLGSRPNTLRFKYPDDSWSNEDVEITESYEFATYYRLDKLSDLCKNVLSGRWSETYCCERILHGFVEVDTNESKNNFK